MINPRLLMLLGAAAALIGCACAPDPPAPSFVLVVLDTTRADAVSAYGKVRGTTPTVDALAADGLLYTAAYANASWTLPSHATLFTGLLPSEHGVNWTRLSAAEELTTLAERLSEAGYETVGFSENGWVSEAFNMTQGFETFSRAIRDRRTRSRLPLTTELVAHWLQSRDPKRPFFLFINMLDAHHPYKIDPAKSPRVQDLDPKTLARESAASACDARPAERVALVQEFYLGGVSAADTKLAQVMAMLRDTGLEENLVTVVTADHGEHFGEHDLHGHVVGVREALVRVPLVIHGAPGAAAGAIAQAVDLSAIAPTLMHWAGVPLPAGMRERVLPTQAKQAEPGEAIVAEWYDPDAPHIGGEVQQLRDKTSAARQGCGPDDRVRGTMRALIRYPMKLVWYDRYPMELYDLATDPLEGEDLAASSPEIVASLQAELQRRVHAARAVKTPEGVQSTPVLSEDLRENLRGLGYLEEEP